MTSRLILDEFNLDLSSPGLLVRLGLFFIFIFVRSTLIRSVVVDERVVSYGSRQWRWVTICPWVPWEVRALALSHRG